MKLAVLAEKIGAVLLGPDGDVRVSGVSTLQDAGPGDVCYYGNRAYRKYLSTTSALAVITGEKVETSSRNLLLVEHPQKAFSEALVLFGTPVSSGFPGIHPSAVVHRDADLGEGVSVGPCSVIDADVVMGDGTRIGSGCYVGPGARIGSDCIFYSGVHVYHGCVVGDRVILHSGVVIGADGFGFIPGPDGPLKVSQNGNVVLGDDVEIGAGSTIDRAVVGSTRIGDGTKIDNLVHVAHNVIMGSGCLVAAQTGIAGSTVVGDNVTFGGQAGITGHVRIGDGAVVAAQSGVMKDVPAGMTVSGYPAREHDKSVRMSAALGDLPRFRRRVLDFIERSGEEGNVE